MRAPQSVPETAPCALLSVSDKRDIEKLAAAFVKAGVRLLSTGGTASALRRAGHTVTDVSEHTGAAEMMAGRVKTPASHRSWRVFSADAVLMMRSCSN